jgi:hypothetical protein
MPSINIGGAYAVGVSFTCTNEDESSRSMSSIVKIHCQARRKPKNGFQVDLKIVIIVLHKLSGDLSIQR